MNISDENKHQYISCVGSQGGLGSSIVTLAGGTYREAKDIYKKLLKFYFFSCKKLKVLT